MTNRIKVVGCPECKARVPLEDCDEGPCPHCGAAVATVGAEHGKPTPKVVPKRKQVVGQELKEEEVRTVRA